MINKEQNQKLIDFKFNKYIEAYEVVSEGDIKGKTYNITLFRGLIMYYLYQENCRKNLKISLKEIGKKFGMSSHSSVIYIINKTKEYIENIQLLKRDYRTKFVYLNYVFNKILNQKFQTKTEPQYFNKKRKNETYNRRKTITS